MKQYIIESASRMQMQVREFKIHNQVLVTVVDPLPENINLKTVIKKVEENIPKHLLLDVESIYIGVFKALEDRQIDSMYIDGSILITNNQPNDKELYGTIVHEFAHATEEAAKDSIYGDGDLAREFLAKRKTLFNLLKDDYQLNKKEFLSIDFTQSFDDLMHKSIGYDNLGVITNGLFMSPYAATSLREYFANGFEHYFLQDSRELRKISPVLSRKIRQLLNPDSIL